MSVQAPTWAGLELAGRYRVTHVLGEGGMGIVYRSWDNHLQTDVVLKAPLRKYLHNEDIARRFVREIRSLVQLAHPHIVKILDVGSHDGVPFAALQYLSGGSLKDRQVLGPDRRTVPHPPESLTGWLESVASALDFIHGQGFVHRDVKPPNILF